VSKKLGVVSWFDHSSGEGMIYCPKDGQTYYVHWSAIKTSTRSFFKEILVLNKRHPVEFTLYTNSFMSQVDSVWMLEFNYSIESEHKLTRLMNELFEAGSDYVFDLADIYYA
jgi:cold shock CspA family protein